MRQAHVAGWTSFMAVLVSAAVLVLMLYRGLAAPEPGEPMSLDPVGWVITVSALGCLAVSVVLAAFVRFHHVPGEGPPEASRPTRSDEDAPLPAGEEAPGRDVASLPEDERRIYGMVEAAGGEILQMRLVSSGEFSKSKVTRLLDKLERRGYIKRERRGMTNLVKLTR